MRLAERARRHLCEYFSPRQRGAPQQKDSHATSRQSTRHTGMRT
jgi:hypothetical protein